MSSAADEYALFDIRKRRRRRSILRRRDKKGLSKSSPELISTNEARKGRGVEERHALLGWFDPEFYQARYPDVAGEPDELLNHYLEHGSKKGVTPAHGSRPPTTSRATPISARRASTRSFTT